MMIPYTALIRKTTLICLAGGLLSLGLSACGASNSDVGQVGKVVAVGDAAIGGPFTLTTHTGETFTQDDLTGKPTLLYFGFSFCPDVCPTALQKMGALQETVDPDGTKLRYVFVGVDVERDTPESLAPYVTSSGFPTGLIGLAGTQAQMDQAVSGYRVYAQKVDDPTSAAEYTFDHSDLVILIGADGQFKDIFTRDQSLPEMATRVKFLLDSGK